MRAYRSGGLDYLSDLARGIHHSAPYRLESAYFTRDVYRSAAERELRDAVGSAIADYT